MIEPLKISNKRLEDDSKMTRTNKNVAAALDSLTDAYGNLERRYAADLLPVPPKVKIRGDKLVWRFGPRLTNPIRESWKAYERNLDRHTAQDAMRAIWKSTPVLPGTGLLRAFVNLADVQPSRILSYAKRWGVLGICDRHNLPISHPKWAGCEHHDVPTKLPQFDSADCEPCGWDGGGGWDPLERWRFFARQAQAILLVAYRLGSGDHHWTAREIRGLAGYVGVREPPSKQGPWKSWEAVASAVNARCSTAHEPSDTWESLSVAVNDWLTSGDVRPQILLGDNDDRPRLVLATDRAMLSRPGFPLFGALGIQLAFAVTTGGGWAFCSTCATCFEPGRAPHRYRANYCEDCASRGRWRRAQAKRRALGARLPRDLS